ncbi:MAG: hypothetical protein CSA58_09825 [Micrococcales bacterium]|nr:MAG: hypothetical protein CSA58_09825 [Micrococcales bacterium]
MKPTSYSWLAALFGAGVVLGWSGARIWNSSGGSPMPVPLTSILLLLGIAVAVLVAAWPVRQWQKGVRSKSFSPLRAARAAVLAKAASHSGAGLAGWYAGQALLLLPDLGIASRRSAALELGGGVLVAVVVIIAGLVAERWCRLSEDDEDSDQDPGGDAVPA